VATLGTPRTATTTAGSFALPKGTISFQPTAAVRNGGQVAYGIPNASEAKVAQGAGGTVESGKTLMGKGWSNLTAGALYLVR
jgi:hypothetical protein